MLLNKMIMRFSIVLLILAVHTFACYGQKQVTEKSLLEDLANNESVARWPEPHYTEWMASSYDRRSVSPDAPGWFGNSDFSQYIRTEERSGHREHVMLDADGPGAIVRFWLTTTPERNGVLRIYLDNEEKPVVTINGYDLMKSNYPLVIPHSSYQPNGKGGSTMYLPIPFAKHCKITWEEKEQSNPPRYYQINYRKYAEGTKVITFHPNELPSLKELIRKKEKQLWNPSITEEGKIIHINKHVAPHQTASLKLPGGASEIQYLEIKAAAANDSDNAQILRSTILNISFDGHRTVWCPLGDFSGAGVGGKPLNSWYRSVRKDGTITSRWIMPYRTKATISLVNASKDSVNILLNVCVKKIRWDSSTMYFHASWKQALNELVTKWDTAGASELNMIKIKGKGLYMGNTLAVFNHMHTWYGEGDQKIWRGNINFPVEYGTGLEDYYNTSWAPVVLYQTPFANAPRADNPDSYGYNTFTRTRNLDAVPFDSSFQMNLEMLGWQSGKADFASTIYWYGFKGATDNCADVDAQAAYSLPDE